VATRSGDRTPGTVVAGIDGCKGGWLVVTVPAEGSGPVVIGCVPDLGGVIAGLESGRLAAAAIDIPIGLPEAGPRWCDTEARKRIGARRSSVFPAPARAVLGATSYADALFRSRAASGQGLSRQTFALLPKIAAVDAVITPQRQRRLFEVHPEVSFRVLAGGAMAYWKRTPHGRAERLAALRGPFPDIDARSLLRPVGAAPDDVLDAFAAAWSARRWTAGRHERLGGDLDQRGLRMEMIA
jgi:predicted RNase H-like nuclease